METLHFRRAWSRLAKLGRSERGGLIVPAAFVALPLTGLIVVGVDYARVVAVQARLQTAVDAAALVAGSPVKTLDAAKAEAKALYFSNFGRTDKTTGASYLGAVASDPDITVGSDSATVSATVTLRVSPFAVVSGQQQMITANATVKRAMYGMELALVLDVTGSMASNDNIGGLRTAASNLIDILYGTNETVPNFSVSVVPYTATVNIGKTRTNWLEAGSLNQNNYANGEWAGCVEARLNGQDMTDALASTQPFKPFFWPTTLDLSVSPPVSRYKDAAGRPVKGDNEWSPTNITEGNQANLPDNTAVGPNLGCPAFPILSLTTAKTTVKNTISSLRATFRGGTMANLGLQVGWFTLSPTWKGQFGDPNSPLPYNTTNMDKVVVMMTDGNNEWYDWPGGAPGSAPSAFVGQTTDADYTAYGRLSENRLGLSNNTNLNARDEINRRTTTLCTSMKAQGIKIYTVVLGSVDSSTQALWQGCASKPEYYFNSPDKTALAGAFKQIGSQLASLRISK